MLYVSYINTHS